MIAALRQRFRIIAALVIREITTRYGTRIGGYAWAIIEPVAFIATLSLIFSAIARTPPLGRSFMLFYATGYLAFWIYRTMADQVSKSVQVNKALLTYPVVSPLDTILARTTLQIVTQFVVCVAIFSGIFLLIEHFSSISPAPVLAAFFLAISLGMGIGITNCVLFHFSGLYEKIFQIVSRPLFFISGIFFLPDSIPHPYREYLLWNPIAHIVSLFRQGFYPTYRAHYIDISYVLALSASFVVAGLSLLAVFGAKVREA
ncbi:ABC transporter permease [Stappia sp. GBMRC 2046]|uniref:Transport permease protein n=1 Tax=Stappia sediminis TaxID=2692190 RepID=A0A7X3S9Q8_9HYPH|nr:ABC transporter permease [Stappia sediminis]MXN67186.1 ABC transporter permease [Stappia sediminis]